MKPFEFEKQMNILTASLMRPQIAEKAMGVLYEKFSKCDAEIFAVAIKSLSLGEYMPKAGQIFSAYNSAKASARAQYGGDGEYQGCKFCDKGLVPYTWDKGKGRGPISYLGWCGCCNPPISKDGKHKMFSDRNYPGVKFQCGPASELMTGSVSQKEAGAAIRRFTGTQDPDKEKDRQANKERIERQREKEAHNSELPF